MLYILLPIHNRRQLTKEFMKCLQKQTYQDFHLVLIDDGSTDGTADMVCNYLPDTTVIKGKGDWWWGGALHQGYKWIRKHAQDGKDFVLIINDDTSFEKDFLEKAVKFLQNKEKTLLLACTRSIQTGKIYDTGTKIDWAHFTFRNANEGEEIDCLATRGLFVRVEDFLMIGGFHPFLLPHYLSDYEWTIRAKRKGFRLITTLDIWLWNNEITTGYHKVENNIRSVFSKKSAVNPLYLFNFILLACPLKYKLSAIYHGIVRKVIHYLLREIKEKC